MNFADFIHQLKAVAPGFKLRAYYNLVGVASIIVPVIIGLAIIYRPSYFNWLVYPSLMAGALLGVAVYQILVFILHKIFQKPVFWSFLAGGWVLFYFLAIIASGGPKSTLIFILIMPLLASTIRLDRREIKAIGLGLTVGLALTIFIEPLNLTNPAIICQHIIQVSLFALIAFYFYRIVSETVRYKVGEEETRQQLLNAIELNQIKKTFIMVASHQLRTPLSAAHWALGELAKNKAIDQLSQDLINSAEDRISRALSIVSDLLKSAEETTERYSLEQQKEKIDLTALVPKLIDDTQLLASRQGVKIFFKLPQKGIFVVGNKSFLYSALLNLVDNAIHYSPQSQVEISLERKDKQAILKVIDSGIGISEEDQTHLFEQFYRGQNAVALEPDGSGMGLTLTKRIIENLNGQISLQSKLGHGTTVTVALPLAK